MPIISTWKIKRYELCDNNFQVSMQQWIIEFCNTGLWWKVVEMKSAAVPKYYIDVIWFLLYTVYIDMTASVLL
jgi:hypothetical protein